MVRRKVFRKDLLRGCARIGEGDGHDPRLDPRDESSRVKNRKALQLAAEVERTLSAVLGGECGDPVLRELALVSVTPAPWASQLLVTLTLPEDSSVDQGTVLVHLERARGRLRQEIAAALHRRKTPDLIFRVAR